MRREGLLTELMVLGAAALCISPLLYYGVELVSPSQLSTDELYTLYLLYTIGALSLSLVLRWVLRHPFTLSDQISQRNPLLIAYLSGGAHRLSQLITFKLCALGAVKVSAHRGIKRVGAQPLELKRVEEVVYYLVPEDHEVTLFELKQKLTESGALERYDQLLAEGGFIIQSRLRRLLMGLLPQLALFSPYLIFKIATPQLTKALVSSDRALFYLAFSFLIYLLCVRLIAPRVSSHHRVSIGGERWLKWVARRLRHRPVSRSPSLEWAMFLLALKGPKGLFKTSCEPVAQLLMDYKGAAQEPQEVSTPLLDPNNINILDDL